MGARKDWLYWTVALIASMGITSSAYGAKPEARETAEMVELDGEGAELLPAAFRLTRWDQGDKPHSFMLEGAGGGTFRIIGASTTPCGTTLYEAVQISRGRRTQRRTLRIEDFRGRTCMDLRRYLWEARLLDGRQSTDLFGNPRPIESEDCKKLGEDVMCIALYAPATCTASTADAGTTALRPPLEASGANACVAGINLRIAACERGIASDRLKGEDIQCFLTGEPY